MKNYKSHFLLKGGAQMGKICHACEKTGKIKDTRVDKNNPNRPIAFHNYVCDNPECMDYGRWIGDEDIRGKY